MHKYGWPRKVSNGVYHQVCMKCTHDRVYTGPLAKEKVA